MRDFLRRAARWARPGTRQQAHWRAAYEHAADEVSRRHARGLRWDPDRVRAFARWYAGRETDPNKMMARVLDFEAEVRRHKQRLAYIAGLASNADVHHKWTDHDTGRRYAAITWPDGYHVDIQIRAGRCEPEERDRSVMRHLGAVERDRRETEKAAREEAAG